MPAQRSCLPAATPRRGRARRTGDREELLAACAVAACEELGERFASALASEPTPAEQLAAISAAYVRFAAERRPMFDVLHGAGLDKSKHPQLEDAAIEVLGPLSAIATKLTPNGSDEETGVLVQALTGLAQGNATLLLDGGFGELPGAVDLAAQRARAATAALLRGRSLLFAQPAAG